LPRQFRHVRVLLLRHDRRAGAEAVGDLDEADARAHPHDQFFRQAADVHHQQRAGGGEFDGEVAVGYGIQRVLADAFEAELFGDVFAVDRVGRAGQRGGAERQAGNALAAIDEALGIAAEHFEVGQHVVAEGDRLGDLCVKPGIGVAASFGQIDQGAAEGLISSRMSSIASRR
jgi:hypothetical protein